MRIRIDRKSGKAQHPRQMERVPAIIVFDFEIIMDIYDGDDKDKMLVFETSLCITRRRLLGRKWHTWLWKSKNQLHHWELKPTKFYESNYPKMPAGSPFPFR